MGVKYITCVYHNILWIYMLLYISVFLIITFPTFFKGLEKVFHIL